MHEPSELGENKKDYMQYHTDREGMLLSSDQISLIANYYKNKKIDIYVQNSSIGFKKEQVAGSQNEEKLQATISALNEMLNIQKTLSDHQYVGYLYTNGSGSMNHIEAFIVGKNKIIKPVEWNVSLSCGVYPDRCIENLNYASSELAPFANGRRIIPQKTGFECGSLGIAYLKNYLQGDAKQLKEFSLSIPYFEDTKLKYFFFPSPHVLRYSQSGLYNQFIEAMILNDESGTFIYKNEPVFFTSLQAILTRTIKQDFDANISKDAEVILDKLPEFKVGWLQRYEKIQIKRQQMGNSLGNRYLIYISTRMSRIAITQRQNTINPGLELLSYLNNTPSIKISEEELKIKFSQLTFRNANELGYFLNAIKEESLFIMCLSQSFDIINDDLYFSDCLFLLSPNRKIDFIEYFKNSDQSMQIFSKKPKIEHVLSWLQVLRLSEDELVPFLTPRLSAEFWIEKLEKNFKSVLNELFFYLIDEKKVATLISHYISREKLNEVLVTVPLGASRKDFIKNIIIASEALTKKTCHISQLEMTSVLPQEPQRKTQYYKESLIDIGSNSETPSDKKPSNPGRNGI